MPVTICSRASRSLREVFLSKIFPWQSEPPRKTIFATKCFRTALSCAPQWEPCTRPSGPQDQTGPDQSDWKQQLILARIERSCRVAVLCNTIASCREVRRQFSHKLAELHSILESASEVATMSPLLVPSLSIPITKISRRQEETRQLMVVFHGAREVREPNVLNRLFVRVTHTLLDINVMLSTNTGAIQTLPC